MLTLGGQSFRWRFRTARKKNVLGTSDEAWMRATADGGTVELEKLLGATGFERRDQLPPLK